MSRQVTSSESKKMNSANSTSTKQPASITGPTPLHQHTFPPSQQQVIPSLQQIRATAEQVINKQNVNSSTAHLFQK